jgi:CRP-like cAMP-binding protein
MESKCNLRQKNVNSIITLADDLVKPLLHQSEEGKHSYWVVDGAVRYQYTIQL